MPAPIINTPGTKPTSKVTSIAREVEAWARDDLGIVIDHFYGSTTWPDHSNRRCLDIMTAGPAGQQPTWADTGKPLAAAESKTFGDKIRDYLITHAKRLGINGIIWDRHVTGFPHADNPPYRGPYGQERPYSGSSPHTDHNHVEVDSTPYRKPGAYPTPTTRVVYVDKIRPGQKASDSVYWVQKALGVPLTGNYDQATVTAAKKFQADAGDDVVDGDLGPLDLAALFAQHKSLRVRIEAHS